MTTLQPGVATAEVDNGLVLLDERTGHYWALNASAAVVLAALQRGHAVTEAAEHLGQRWTVPPADAQRDVHSLLDALRENGLLR